MFQNLSVSWVFWKFMVVQIYFPIRSENREKYFRNQKKYFGISMSVDRSTPDLHLEKSGENLVYCGGRSLFWKLDWPTLLYSRQWHMELEDWRWGKLLLLYITRWVKWNIVLTSKEYARNVIRQWFLKMLQIMIRKNLSRHS